jgi:hypothetical protein
LTGTRPTPENVSIRVACPPFNVGRASGLFGKLTCTGCGGTGLLCPTAAGATVVSAVGPRRDRPETPGSNHLRGFVQMGLFGGLPPTNINPVLESAVVASNDKARDRTLRTLAKSEGGILSGLEPDERPLCVAYYMGEFGGDNVIVVTDRRSIMVKKGKFERQLRHNEVAETTRGQMPNGQILVEILSSHAKLDFRPNDAQRYAHIIQIQVETPRVASAICAAIDQFL